ncbi:MAG: Glu-tRNA(Gln) amidotransferase subunit GatD [Candidatus Diapherotrites archaeon]|nr:Glu-tRNA(Gln) amidotransferase subunit GatD [Candidatus Diapherotrites archaeon]
MAYSREIQGALKAAKAAVGDRIVVGSEEGLLMPSPEITASPDHIVLKLDNGYNIGIKYEGQTISKSSTPEPKRITKEYKYETGGHAKAKQSCKGKKHIALLGAGGTITSRVDYSTGAVYTDMTGDDLIALVPELGDIACIKTKTVLEKMSEDLDPLDWVDLAKATAKALDKAEGVIITQGTDTMHYTSAALSFMLNTTKPVIITGAQRSSDRGSADAVLNLTCSAYAALSDIAEVGTCMHATFSDDYCYFLRGTKVRKMSSTVRPAFKPINDYPLAKIYPDGKIEPISKFKKRGTGKTEVDTKFERHIALLKAYPGSDPKIIDYHVDSGAKGLVIEGTALGHVPTKARKSWIPRIKSAVKSGVPIVVATQCIYGTVNPNVYTNLRILYHDAGAIPAYDMTAETAYVKLGWVLAHAKGDKVKELMTSNLKGELNPQLEPDMFLYK